MIVFWLLIQDTLCIHVAPMLMCLIILDNDIVTATAITADDKHNVNLNQLCTEINLITCHFLAATRKSEMSVVGHL